MTLTPDRIEELRRLEAEATRGPWCVHPNGTSVWRGEEYDSSGTLPDHGMVIRGPLPASVEDGYRSFCDLDFVAAVRNVAPELLAAAEEANRLRELLAEARPLLVHEAPYFNDLPGRIDRALASPTPKAGE